MTDHTASCSDFSNLDISFGEYLKQERLKKGISIEIISCKTGIKISNLLALENGERRKLPADAFVRGFIRIYADVLNLDSQKALDSYNKEWGFSNGMKGSTIFLGRNSMAEPSSIFTDKQFLIYILIVALVAAGFFSFNFSSYSIGTFNFLQKFKIPVTFQKKTDRIPSQPPLNDKISSKKSEIIVTDHLTEELANSDSADELSPKNIIDIEPRVLSLKSEQENIDHANIYKPEEISITEKETETGQDITQEPLSLLDQIIDSPDNAIEHDEDINFDAGIEKISEPFLPTKKSVEVATISNTLQANFVEKTWMRITIDQNEPVEYTFQPNEKYSWDAAGKIKLYIGNAGGIQLSLNGMPIKIDKKSGETVKMTIP